MCVIFWRPWNFKKTEEEIKKEAKYIYVFRVNSESGMIPNLWRKKLTM